MNKAIFFDRDGVLIKAPTQEGFPKSSKNLNEISLCNHIEEICKFYKNKFLLIMTTNQPDFTRGNNSKESIVNINNYLKKKLLLDDVCVCYCDDDSCINRKPNPGMLNKCKEKYQLNMKECFIIGDRWRDIGAGINANCKTIFIDYGYKEKNNYLPDFAIKNLNEVFNIIK